MELRAEVGWERVEGFGGREGACEVEIEVLGIGVEAVCGSTPNDDVAPEARDFVSDRIFHTAARGLSLSPSIAIGFYRDTYRLRLLQLSPMASVAKLRPSSNPTTPQTCALVCYLVRDNGCGVRRQEAKLRPKTMPKVASRSGVRGETFDALQDI